MIFDFVRRPVLLDMFRKTRLTNEATGSPIVLNDSANGDVLDFKVYGRSNQTQYSGKNLANVKDRTSQTREGITSTITNKIISASGTATSGTADIVVDLDTPITIKSGTYYTLSLQKITGTMSTGFTVYLFDTVTSTYPHYYDLVNTNSITFNLASDISCSSVLIRLPMSHTINGTFRLQLEEGTTATVYEPYVGGTASPNPSYPQAIKSVGDGGTLRIISKGKNLLQNTASVKTVNGVTFSVRADGTVLVNGTATAVTELVIGSVTATKGEYILNGSPVTNSNSGLRLYDGVTHKCSDAGNGCTYDVTNETTLKVSIIVNNGVKVDNLVFKPMLRLASITDDTYEPYTRTTKKVTLHEPLRGIGEVKDELNPLECKITRRFAEVVFDGSDDEGWIANSDISVFYIVIDNVKILQPCLCDHYSNMYTNSIGYLCINASDTGCTTLAEFKAHLQSNPITVVYELAEPTTETLGAALVSGELETHNSFSYITATDNPDMWVYYYTDTAQAVVDQISALDERDLYLESWTNSDEFSFGLNPCVELPSGISNTDYMIVSCDYGFAAYEGGKASMYYTIDQGTDGVTPIVRFNHNEIITYVEDTLGQIEQGNKYIHLRVMLRKIVK